MVTGAASLTTTPANPTAPNTYTITAANGTLAASNYSFTFVNGTLTITKATPTITWNNPAAITYGTALSASQLNASATVAGTFSYSPALGTVLSAGSHTLSVTFNPTNTTDYTPQTATVPLVVNQANLNVTANSQTAVYGTALAPYTANITGFVNGDTLATAVTGTPSLTTTPATPVNVGTYTITAAVGTLVSSNYAFTFSTGTVTITKASLTVTAASQTVTYGTALAPYTYTMTGFVGSDTQATATTGVPSLTTSPATPVNVGTYAITAAAGTLASANYSFVYVNGSVTITKATLTVTANSASRPYNTANPAFTGTITGAVNGDIFTESFSTTAITTSPVGSYPITPTAAGTNLGNYTVVTTPGTLSVTQVSPVINWNNPAAITYGTALGATQLNATVTGAIAGNLVYTPAAGVVLGQGTQTLSVTFTPTDTTDYATVTKTVQIVVNQAVLTVTAASQTVTYGTALAPYTYTMTGFVGSDTQATATTGVPSLTTSPATPVNVGTYAITAAAGTLASANYSFVYVNGSVTITKATLNVTANSASRPYNTANPTFTGTITGAVNGDIFTESFSTTATITSPVGSYPITPTAAGTNLGNYTVVTTPGTLTVTQVSPVINWNNPAAITYGTALGATQLNATVTGGDRGQPGLHSGLGRGSGSGDADPVGDLHPDRHHRLRDGDQDGADRGQPGGADGDGGEPDGNLWDGSGALHVHHDGVRGQRYAGDGDDGRAESDDVAGDSGQRGHVCDHGGAGDAGFCELQLRVRQRVGDHHQGDVDGVGQQRQPSV